MISVILYGKNDQHGYNYHKRCAISINCISTTLSNHDEIVFVDYNSPQDYPSLPETIQDTLTEKSKNILKIFRYFDGENTLLESHARNIGIYKSNPNNKWILSTNTDMIFLPKEKIDLSKIVARLDPGMYCLPRFEIPEWLWESHFDRYQPEKILEILGNFGKNLHFTVRRNSPIFFDNPGDFQLIPRADLISLGGFDERMKKKWHIDSNLVKRAFLFYGKINSLENELNGFHCNHNRKSIYDICSRKKNSENNWHKFIVKLSSPYCKNEWKINSIQEVSLLNKKYLSITDYSAQPVEKTLDLKNYNNHYYNTACSFQFLLDHLSVLHKNIKIDYFGCNSKMKKLIYDMAGSPLKKNKNPSLIIFDFGVDIHSRIKKERVEKYLKLLVNRFISEVEKQKNPVKFLAINVSNTDFFPIISRHLAMVKTTQCTNVYFGYPKKITFDFKNEIHYWLVRMLYPKTKNFLEFFSKTRIGKKYLRF